MSTAAGGSAVLVLGARQVTASFRGEWMPVKTKACSTSCSPLVPSQGRNLCLRPFRSRPLPRPFRQLRPCLLSRASRLWRRRCLSAASGGRWAPSRLLVRGSLRADAVLLREEQCRTERKAQKEREREDREEAERRRKAAAWACPSCGREVLPDDGWETGSPGGDCSVCTNIKNREREQAEAVASEEAEGRQEARRNGLFGFLR